MAWRRFLYQKVLSEYLLVTNILASGALDGVGDFLEQRLERVHPHDWRRTARMVTMGFMLGPPDHYWYKVLDRHLPGRRIVTVGKKVTLDMLIMGPFTIAAFYLGEGELKGSEF